MTKKVTMDNFSVMIQVFAHINFVDGKPTEIVVEPDADKDFFYGLDTEDGRRLTEDDYYPDSTNARETTNEIPADIDAMKVAFHAADLSRVPWRLAESTAKERARVINGHRVIVYPSGHPDNWVYAIYPDPECKPRNWEDDPDWVRDGWAGPNTSYGSEQEAWGAAILDLDRMGALPPTDIS